jgi:hypothetical protein
LQLPDDVPAGCAAFGRELLNRADLDPVYPLVRFARLRPKEYAQVVLGYLMFYHLGVAARLGEAPDFWEEASRLCATAPRGTERRHFRGDLARLSILRMKDAGCAETVVSRMAPPGADYWAVTKAVQTFYGFGSWIAFKAVDMFDRTGFRDISIPTNALTFYRDPMKGVALYLYRDPDVWKDIDEKDVTDATADLLARPELVGRLAPPDYRRQLTVAEAETIFCKYKSHLNGKYPPGKDLHEVLHGLDGWGDLAEEMKQCAIAF